MEAIRIRISQVKEDMIVANDIYSSNNHLVVAKGTTLNARIIEKLHFYDISGLYVYKTDKKMDDLQGESYINLLRSSKEFIKFNETYIGTVEDVKEDFDKILTGEADVDVDKLLKSTRDILDKSRNGAHALEMLHGIRDYDDLTFIHSMNVSIICNIFAKWLELSDEETQVLTLCGLLHDVGKMKIPDEILLKNDKLTDEEYKLMKTHTTKGYQLLKNLDIDDRIKQAALLHHERCDGSGYPNGFTRKHIQEYAKIVAIADVYDAMTSDRYYRARISPFEVVRQFEREGLGKYDPKFLMLFLERIVNAYLHNIVELNDGRQGEVVLINKHSLSQPVVRIGKDFVDLSKQKDIKIVSVV